MNDYLRNDFWTRYYSSLNGAKIVRFQGMTNDEDWGDGFPTFLVQFPDGSKGTIEISQDPEGNGGGFIFGLPLTEPDPIV